MNNRKVGNAIVGVLKTRSFWIIVILTVAITVLHYEEVEKPLAISNFLTNLGLTRHALDRILYLAPITLAGYAFGWVGGLTMSLLALAAMLPRAFLISPAPLDSVLESVSVFIIGNVLAMTFYSLRKEKQYRKELEEARDKMRFYLAEVNKAQEEERKRISQELHDDTIQSLVVLSRNLDLLATQGNGLSEEHRRRLEELRQQSNGIVVGLRRLSQDLRPAALDKLGLLSALEWLAGDVSKYSGIEVKTAVSGDFKRLGEEKELVIFRIVQEALRNVWRHSKATRAEVKVDAGSGYIEIVVSDNGQGFSMPNIADLPGEGKLGMAGMFERAQLIGANLKVESEPGHGTRVNLRLNTIS